MAKLSRLVANDRIYVDILYLQLDGVVRLYKYQFITIGGPFGRATTKISGSVFGMSDSFHGILVEDCSEKETLSFLLRHRRKTGKPEAQQAASYESGNEPPILRYLFHLA